MILPSSRALAVLVVALAAAGAAAAPPAPAPSPATRQLQAGVAELRAELVPVAPGVWVATGYGVSNIGVVEGPQGLVLIDSGEELHAAALALEQIRKVSARPVKAIVYTHSHVDHIGGARALAGDDAPQIWARRNFGSEDAVFRRYGLAQAAVTRGVRQAGFMLPMDQRISQGIAIAKRPHGSFGDGRLEPTHFMDEPVQVLRVAGLELELHAAPGETEDQLFVWLPDRRVLFTGDNLYASFPNIYPIRGANRDVKDWVESLDRMVALRPEHLVPGHARPVIGAAAAQGVVTAYRDAVRHVLDTTVAGINRGLTPDELVAAVKLPEPLARHPFLQEVYGNVGFAVRNIFSSTLGWFDGNGTRMFPLPDTEQGPRLARLLGGPETLLAHGRAALAGGDAQWAAHLADWGLGTQPERPEFLHLKADALAAVAEGTLTATARNYLLTQAAQIRSRAERLSRPPATP